MSTQYGSISRQERIVCAINAIIIILAVGAHFYVPKYVRNNVCKHICKQTESQIRVEKKKARWRASFSHFEYVRFLSRRIVYYSQCLDSFKFSLNSSTWSWSIVQSEISSTNLLKLVLTRPIINRFSFWKCHVSSEFNLCKLPSLFLWNRIKCFSVTLPTVLNSEFPLSSTYTTRKREPNPRNLFPFS